MYLDDSICVSLDTTDTVDVRHRAGDYRLIVRDRLGNRQLVVEIPAPLLDDLTAGIHTAQHRRLTEATENIA